MNYVEKLKDPPMFPPKYKRKALPRAERFKVLDRDKLKCVNCLKDLSLSDFDRIKNGAFHHIVPLVYGGENKASNACLLCEPCHIKIHTGRETKQKYLRLYENYLLTGRLF